MSSTEIEIKIKIPTQSSSQSQPASQPFTNPYELIKIMNRIIADLKQQIQEYELAFQSMRKEKEVWLGEKKRLETAVMELIGRIELFRGEKSSEYNIPIYSKVNLNIHRNFYLASPTSNKLQYTSIRRFQKNEQAKSGLFDLQNITNSHNNITKRIDDTFTQHEEEYIPQPIRLTTKHKSEHNSLSLINNTLENFNKDYVYGENMIEAFVVIGPEIGEFKKKRVAERGKDQVMVKPTSLYCHGKYYKEHKSQFIAEIAKRAFPEGCRLRKKIFDHNEELLDLIEYKPNRILSEDYFVFTLKGDESLFTATQANPALRKSFLYIANPNYFLFIVCLKLPDFIYVRDEKNYQRKENEVWVGQKIYALASYFPFFNIHTEILFRIHSIMSKIMIRKILIDNENILMWNIAKTIYDLEKNQEINDTLSYFLNKKPDYKEVCHQSSYYFGTLPQFGFKSQYAMLLYCCPIFLSNFAYEEMLLLLTSILCQKTLIFLSKSETMATLSALFLINLISPFQYYETLMLNCDSQKVREMIFEFPFPMVCSIKRTDQNLEEILSLFAESNTMRLVDDDAQYIVVDVDSNSILYHPALQKLFTECIAEPNKNLRQAYNSINPCKSKSFSLPTELPRENFKPNTKPKSQGQKRMEQIRKNVKQYMEKISTNQTKIPVYHRSQKHEELVRLLTGYMQDFTICGENDYQIIGKLESCSKNSRVQVLKGYLMERKENAGRQALIGRFLESQMYANYLDAILKNS